MPAALTFQWDPAKASSNEEKHRVTFEYGSRVFLDPMVAYADVTRPDDRESRMKTIGVIDGLLYSVTYTMRGPALRIISARRANTQERRVYGPPIHP